MKSKKSLFNAVLIKEDLKRFVPIPVIVFCLYFLVYGMPLLDVDEKEGLVHIPTSIYNLHWAGQSDDLRQSMILCVSAVLCAVSVFAYLHSKSSATAAHAMPFQRKTIFASHCLAGGILAAAPVICSALIFILICAVQTAFGNGIYSVRPAESVPYAAVYLMWMGISLVALFFVYAVSVLAAVIAGTLFTHILLAMFLNGLLPMMSYMVNEYIREFWIGVYYDIFFGSRLLSPVSTFFCGYIPITIKLITIYVAVSAVVILFSGFLYKKIPLEKENSSVVFRKFGESVCMLFAFMGMTMAGLFGQSIMETKSRAAFLIFAFAGALLFYLIGRMILEKKVQVFTLGTWKKFGVFLLLAALFCAITVYDVTGFSKRIPEPTDVKSVSLKAPMGFLDDQAVFSEKESIEEIASIHELLVENNIDFPGRLDDSVSLVYELKNGRKLKRTYNIDLLSCRPVFEKCREFYNTEEFQTQLLAVRLIENSKIEKLQTVRPLPVGQAHIEYYIPKEKQTAFIEEFEKAILEDEKARTYYQVLKKERAWFVDEEVGYELDFKTDASPSYSFVLLEQYDKNAIRVVEKYLKTRYKDN